MKIEIKDEQIITSKPTKKFVAFDGEEFKTKRECTTYEMESCGLIDEIKKIKTKHVTDLDDLECIGYYVDTKNKAITLLRYLSSYYGLTENNSIFQKLNNSISNWSENISIDWWIFKYDDIGDYLDCYLTSFKEYSEQINKFINQFEFE